MDQSVWPIPERAQLDTLLSLHGRVAVVTGGSRGIGEAIVLRLVEAGAKVVMTGRGKQPLVFLASDMAGYISGACLHVDGGQRLR